MKKFLGLFLSLALVISMVSLPTVNAADVIAEEETVLFYDDFSGYPHDEKVHNVPEKETEKIYDIVGGFIRNHYQKGGTVQVVPFDGATGGRALKQNTSANIGIEPLNKGTGATKIIAECRFYIDNLTKSYRTSLFGLVNVQIGNKIQYEYANRKYKDSKVTAKAGWQKFKAEYFPKDNTVNVYYFENSNWVSLQNGSTKPYLRAKGTADAFLLNSGSKDVLIDYVKLSATGIATPEKLATPANLIWDKENREKISWNEVPGAKAYRAELYVKGEGASYDTLVETKTLAPLPVDPEAAISEPVNPEPETTEPVNPEPETTEPGNPEPETTEPGNPEPESPRVLSYSFAKMGAVSASEFEARVYAIADKVNNLDSVPAVTEKKIELPKVSTPNVTFEYSNATWEAVENASAYIIEFKKGNDILFSEKTNIVKPYDFHKIMLENDDGEYSFAVTAEGMPFVSANSDPGVATFNLNIKSLENRICYIDFDDDGKNVIPSTGSGDIVKIADESEIKKVDRSFANDKALYIEKGHAVLNLPKPVSSDAVSFKIRCFIEKTDSTEYQIRTSTGSSFMSAVGSLGNGFQRYTTDGWKDFENKNDVNSKHTAGWHEIEIRHFKDEGNYDKAIFLLDGQPCKGDSSKHIRTSGVGSEITQIHLGFVKNTKMIVDSVSVYDYTGDKRVKSAGVTGAKIVDGTLSFNGVDGASSYAVRIFRNGELFSTKTIPATKDTTNYTLNLNKILNDRFAEFTAKVIVKENQLNLASDEVPCEGKFGEKICDFGDVVINKDTATVTASQKVTVTGDVANHPYTLVLATYNDDNLMTGVNFASLTQESTEINVNCNLTDDTTKIKVFRITNFESFEPLFDSIEK